MSHNSLKSAYQRARSFLRSADFRDPFFTASAAALAYFSALGIPLADPIVASITALISIRPTFHETAAESVRQVIGTIFGALLGFLLLVNLGLPSPIAIFVLIITAFLVPRILRLGQEAAVVMGVTVILVVGPGLSISRIETRVGGVALGSLVALILSYWVRPGLPYNRALENCVVLADETADLLNQIADHLTSHRGRVSQEIADAWVATAEQTMKALAEVRLEAEAAVTASRWSPLLDQNEAKAVLRQVGNAQITARTAYTMAYDLSVAAGEAKVLPGALAENLAQVLSATATVITEQVGSASPETPTEGVLEESRQDAVQQIKDLEDTQPLLLAGSLLRDTEKITAVLLDAEETAAVEPELQPGK